MCDLLGCSKKNGVVVVGIRRGAAGVGWVPARRCFEWQIMHLCEADLEDQGPHLLVSTESIEHTECPTCASMHPYPMLTYIIQRIHLGPCLDQDKACSIMAILGSVMEWSIASLRGGRVSVPKSVLLIERTTFPSAFGGIDRRSWRRTSNPDRSDGVTYGKWHIMHT